MRVQRLVSAVLGVALLALSAGPVRANGGETTALWDTRGHWAEAQIRAAAAAGWVTGYPDGTFRPEGEVTRGSPGRATCGPPWRLASSNRLTM